MENAKFIVSLDFELHWGVFDTLGDEYNKNIIGARSAIGEILRLFKKYDIHATWAIVGMLFNENRSDFQKYSPRLVPSYKDQNLSSYNVKIGENEQADPLHYGHSLVKLIQSYPHQEIASHSYSHYYCKAEGQTKEEFEEDIRSAISVAKDKFNIELKSFVFPKNEINFDYLEILKKYGFSSYRGNPKHWIYKDGQRTNILGRIMRMMDSYINITKISSSEVEDYGGVSNIVGHRFLRPYKSRILNKLMIYRIKKEMLYAAKKKKMYHLWWHPHNFGVNQIQNLTTLEALLHYYQILHKKYNMESVCMQNCQ